MAQPINDLPLPDEKTPAQDDGSNAALNLIRQKVDTLYGKEPDIAEEEKEVQAVGVHSKHQKFINNLMNSGKDMAQVQTEWHAYYEALPPDEKHAVWNEFYANHERTSRYFAHAKKEQSKPPAPAKVTHQAHVPITKTIGSSTETTPEKPVKSAKELKEKLLHTVTAQGKLEKKHHFQSLAFGLGMGALVVLFLMFGFFNERFIAPFITPSRVASNEQIIIDPSASNAVGPLNKVIIPKINVDVPVVYDVPTNQEDQIQAGLERGVVHYPSSPTPGQAGNVVVVGHSSSNIFNSGKFKFAFVLLNRLQEGDTFIMNYNGQRYVYRIYEKKIVKPTEVSVLGTAAKPSTATLITCDPPGTNLNRLVVVGEQISPEPSKNIAVTPPADTGIVNQPAIVPGNSQSLFNRLFGWLIN